MIVNPKFKMVFISLVIASATLSTVAEEPSGFPTPVVQSLEGWTVKLDPQLLQPENKELSEAARGALANHLQRIKYILASDKVAELQEFPIRLDLDNKNFHNFQYHPSEAWLIQHGFDPALAKHVHISQARQLLDPRQWTQHPYAIMHEMAHAYHDQVLGFDHAEIKTAFAEAKKTGNYENVLNHSHGTGKHYALTDAKEYFAESTEAYLGVNDFYPFVRAELKLHDPRMFALQQKIWGEIE